MKSGKRSGIALPLAAGLLVVAGFVSLESCFVAKAIPTAHAAGRLEQVRLGFGLNPEGRVSPGCTASSFAPGDPIHLSMQVAGAGAGSVVRVTVRDTATHRLAWSEEKTAPTGLSYLTFEIGRELSEGRYRAESRLGDEAASSQDFLVHVRNGMAR
jgi:hypothetical protein